MNKLYVFVDIENSVLQGPIQELPKNWNNIMGLQNFNDEKLSDLGWAGHPGRGWYPLNDPYVAKCTYGKEWIKSSQSSLKKLFAEWRWEQETKEVSYGDQSFKIDERTRVSLMFAKNQATSGLTSTFSWKFPNGHVSLSSEELIEFANLCEKYIQDCFSEEKRLCDIANSCTTYNKLISANFSTNWPSTTIK